MVTKIIDLWIGHITVYNTAIGLNVVDFRRNTSHSIVLPITDKTIVVGDSRHLLIGDPAYLDGTGRVCVVCLATDKIIQYIFDSAVTQHGSVLSYDRGRLLVGNSKRVVGYVWSSKGMFVPENILIRTFRSMVGKAMNYVQR